MASTKKVTATALGVRRSLPSSALALAQPGGEPDTGEDRGGGFDCWSQGRNRPGRDQSGEQRGGDRDCALGDATALSEAETERVTRRGLRLAQFTVA